MWLLPWTTDFWLAPNLTWADLVRYDGLGDGSSNTSASWDIAVVTLFVTLFVAFKLRVQQRFLWFAVRLSDSANFKKFYLGCSHNGNELEKAFAAGHLSGKMKQKQGGLT